MSDIITLNSIDELLDGCKTCAVAGHVRPDGDCIGSTSAVYLYVKKYYPDIDLDLYLEEYPESFSFLEAPSNSKRVCDRDSVDLLILCDASSVERIGVCNELYNHSKTVLSIDHHVSNPGIGHYNYIMPEISSTCEVLCNIIHEEKLDNDIATLLYMGMVHDTGAFQYRNTSSKTMRTAAMLMDFGVDTVKLIERTWSQRSYKEASALARGISNAEFFAEGRALVSLITEDELKELNITALDLAAVSSELMKTENLYVSVFIYPADGGYKASFRSRDDYDVSALSVKLGGGGHKNAAGATLNLNKEDAKALVIKEVTALIKGETI